MDNITFWHPETLYSICISSQYSILFHKNYNYRYYKRFDTPEYKLYRHRYKLMNNIEISKLSTS